jgi:outer membrane lipase/esterase
MEQLIAWGAEKFLVMNLPDIGKTPFGVAQADFGADLTRGSELVNAELEMMIAALELAEPQVSIGMVDIYSIFDDLLNAVADDPVAAGFPDANAMSFMPPGLSFCFNQESFEYYCGGSDPEDRVFFDLLHPSSRAHAVISEAVERALLVPEPSMLQLTMFGLVILMAFRKSGKQKDASHVP